ARLRLAVEVVRGDDETVPVRAAANPYRGAGHELRFEPRLVEPRRLDLARLVGDSGAEDLQPSPSVARRRADHTLDDRLVVAEEAADPHERDCRLVTPRPLPEHVLDFSQVELRETSGQRRSDAVQRLHRSLETVTPRCGPRPRPPLR